MAHDWDKGGDDTNHKHNILHAVAELGLLEVQRIIDELTTVEAQRVVAVRAAAVVAARRHKLAQLEQAERTARELRLELALPAATPATCPCVNGCKSATCDNL